MTTIDQKFEILKEDIPEFNTRDELLGILDKRLGKTFNRQLFDELWTNMAQGGQPKEEFIKVLIKAEEILKGKILDERILIEEQYKHFREAELKLDTLSRTEQQNEFKIMSGSQVCVIIVEARNLTLSGQKQCQPYVLIQVDKNERQTKLAQPDNSVFRFDQEKFYFPILTGKEDIRFTLYDYDKYTQNVVIARLDLNLTNNLYGIKEQTLKDIWLDLFQPNQNKNGAQLHVQIQWIHSKVKYLRDELAQEHKILQQNEQNLIYLEEDLRAIYDPFPKWKNLNNHGYKPKPVQVQPNYILPNQQLQAQQPLNNKLHIKYQTKPFNDPILNDNSEFDLLKLCHYLLFVLTLMICFEKAQFLDLVIMMDFYILYFWGGFDENKIKTIGMLYGLSIKLDLAWFFMIGKNWIFPDSVDIKTFVFELSVQRFVAILTIISLIAKIVIIIFCFRISKFISEKTNPNQTSTQKTILQVDAQSNAKSQVYLYQGKPVQIY